MTAYRMQITGQGANDAVVTQIDPSHFSQRASLRPLDHVQLGVNGGIYKIAATYSSTAAKPAAASDVLSLRWTDTRMLLVVKRVTALVLATTAYTAAGAQDLALYRASGFTVSPSGGTQVIPSAGQGNAMRATMKASGLDGSSGVLWVSSGDLLTTGTRVLDTQPMGYFQFGNPTGVVGSPQSGDLLNTREFGTSPLILTANEGIVIQTPIGNAQAAGVTKFGFVIECAEVAAY